MSSTTEFLQVEQTRETASHDGSAGTAAPLAGAFAVIVAIAALWVAFFFGVLQPWLDASY